MLLAPFCPITVSTHLKNGGGGETNSCKLNRKRISQLQLNFGKGKLSSAELSLGPISVFGIFSLNKPKLAVEGECYEGDGDYSKVNHVFKDNTNGSSKRKLKSKGSTLLFPFTNTTKKFTNQDKIIDTIEKLLELDIPDYTNLPLKRDINLDPIPDKGLKSKAKKVGSKRKSKIKFRKSILINGNSLPINTQSSFKPPIFNLAWWSFSFPINFNTFTNNHLYNSSNDSSTNSLSLTKFLCADNFSLRPTDSQICTYCNCRHDPILLLEPIYFDLHFDEIQEANVVWFVNFK